MNENDESVFGFSLWKGIPWGITLGCACVMYCGKSFEMGECFRLQ